MGWLVQERWFGLVLWFDMLVGGLGRVCLD